MNRLQMGLALAMLVFALAFPAYAVTISTVPIGNPGNLAFHDVGAVNYEYQIGTTEVTIGQYTEFLNAVAATDTYSLYNPSMATDLNIAGIARSGISGAYEYTPIGSPNRPVTYVSWGDAVRFCNWLSNGQPTGSQDSSTTESGAYSLNGATSDLALSTVTRNPDAIWFLPNQDEWFKAAYHTPDPNDYPYWIYPTGLSEGLSAPPGDTPHGANVAGYTTAGYVYAVTGSTSYSSTQNYLTDVGAYTASASPYGTFDQGGNVWEWNETLKSADGLRGVRGSSWNYTSQLMEFTIGYMDYQRDENSYIGFRVATVPEPPSAWLVGIALACVSAWRILAETRTYSR
jgi:sulfatase modifying factor 1